MVEWKFLDELSKQFVGCKIVESEKRQWCVNGKAVAWERPLSKKDMNLLAEAAPKGNVLAVRMPDLITRNAWVESVPGVCFVSAHFANYPAVLVDMQKADEQLIRELFDEGVQACLPAELKPTST
jgi:hypothetical protein